MGNNMKYYLINNEIKKATIEMPIDNNSLFQYNFRIWNKKLQPCEISESEKAKIIHTILVNNTDVILSNPIEVTDIITDNDGVITFKQPKAEPHICKYCGAETTQDDDECYAKPTKAKEDSEAVELQYTTKEMIDAVNYGFQYANESQNHTGDVPLGNILQWIMYKRNLLNAPKEFEDLKKNKITTLRNI